MGFRLQQKSMTLNDLERQFTAVPSVLCVLWPKQLRPESRRFHYKVAVHLSYLRIKFDDEIDRGFFDLGT